MLFSSLAALQPGSDRLVGSALGRSEKQQLLQAG